MSEKKKILVVDDDADILSLIGHILELEGYEVELASHGIEALDRLKNTSRLPSFVLLDLMMPYMDGASFIQALSEDPKLSQVSVMVMSASGEREARKKGIDAARFIKKPIDLDTLIEVARQQCETSEL